VSDLFPHQLHGAEWLAGRTRGYLADPPGLGKTRTILAALQLGKARAPLIVCPAIVRPHWEREAAEMGMAPQVVSYDYATKHVNGLVGFDALVLDEAHYARNATAKRTKALFGGTGLVHRAERVYLASGTPIVKSPDDLWVPFSVAFPEVLRAVGLTSRAAWRERFCVMEYNHWSRAMQAKPGRVQNGEALQEILRAVMLRRQYEDVALDLPELLWGTTTLTADEVLPDAPEVYTHYAEGELELNVEHESVARYRRAVGEVKARAAAKLLVDEVEAGSAEVVFAYHRSVLGVLQQAFEAAKIEVSYVDGDTPPVYRQLAIDRFQRGETKIFLGQQTACQTGITLTASHRVTLLEPSWTAQDNVQAGRRVARIGQAARACSVRMIALADTIDEAVVARHKREAKMFTDVMETNRQDREDNA
jgi:SWI/SNF-related matrix-associated actin-dependent regulator of chromatin subfamily A-like protein 1